MSRVWLCVVERENSNEYMWLYVVERENFIDYIVAVCSREAKL